MENKSTIIDFNKICRLCLSEEPVMSSIFNDRIGSVPLPLRIMACVSVEINQTDGLPSQICSHCLYQVDWWYKFKDLCESADSTLRKLVHNEPVPYEIISKVQETALEVKRGVQPDELMPSSQNFENITNNENNTSLEKPEGRQKLTRKTEKQVTEATESDNSLPWHFEEKSEEKLDIDDELSSEKNHNDALPSGEKKKRKLNYVDITYDDPVPTKDGKVHQCRVCRKYLKNVTSRNRHEIERHPPPLACEFCEKTFATVLTYHTHRNIHLGLTNFKCRFCGKYLASQSNLDDHEKVHTKERPIACPQCDKTFSSLSNLKVHLKFHAGVKTYFCHVCGKGHVTAGNLKLHVKRHLNERSHICHICGKGFNGKSELNKHIESHNIEKKFACEYCFLKLKTPNSLRRHVNIQHLKLKPHKCEVCHKDFGRRENLREHMQVHALKKEFQCESCARQFTHFRYLKKHKCE